MVQHQGSNSIKLNPLDNVAVALHDMAAGDMVDGVGTILKQAVPAGHKIAVNPIAKGSPIIKYGHLIGSAASPIGAGEHVHVHNVYLQEQVRSYDTIAGTNAMHTLPAGERRSFNGYVRENGSVGTRNYIGVLSTVSCSGDVSHFLADAIQERLLGDCPEIDGVVPLSHGGGCCHAPDSEGLAILQRTIGGYAKNPNFGAIIVVGLGCEVNLVKDQLQFAGLQTGDSLQSITIQEAGGTEATIEQGLTAARPMLGRVRDCKRQEVSAQHLVVGLECGGSDAYSGITANPALGAAVDLVVHNGGTAILSETPEIYGAEHLLVQRAASGEIGEALIERIGWWERYTSMHGAQINNNPTPGNKAGGISTILEKSMGAVTKAGSAPLNGVYRYGERVDRAGLVFMDTPGYDVVSITGMIAGGANMICFTTGRGTVCGFRPVPTLKIATNTPMYRHMERDMDINCGVILDGSSTIKESGAEIFETILSSASGNVTKSEALGFGGTEFVPWQMGAVL